MKDFLNENIKVNQKYIKQVDTKIKINQTPIKRHFSLRPKFVKMPVYNLDQVSFIFDFYIFYSPVSGLAQHILGIRMKFTERNNYKKNRSG